MESEDGLIRSLTMTDMSEEIESIESLTADRTRTQDRLSGKYMYQGSPATSPGSTNSPLSLYATPSAGSHGYGPSSISGSATVHLGNAFYQCNHDILSRDSDLESSKALKSALYFSTMDDRRAQLDIVSPSSFEWVWTKTEFSNWLRSSQGMFWISGKPGSGKSTLMHHFVNSEKGKTEVRRHLDSVHGTWILIHFYFDYRAETDLANTPVGMLRAMLLQLINKSKPVKDAVLKKCEHRIDGKWPELESELLDLFCDAVRSAQAPVCGFIDGLDEYKGNLRTLADTVLRLQSQSGIKLCVASRPETELSFRLRRCSGFVMEQHNSATIDAYLETTASELEPYLSPNHLDQLLDFISSGSNGVILWARFAVDEVVDGALSGCSFSEIYSRLNTFPAQLESTYVRIWDNLNEKQKLQAALLFYIINNWNTSFATCQKTKPIPLFTEHFRVLWCATLRQLDEAIRFESINFTEVQFRLRVHALIRGLVEFVPTYDDNFHKVLVPRLVHESLQAFLQQRQDYQDFTRTFKKILPAETMGLAFYAQVIVQASKDIEPDATYDQKRTFRLKMRYKSNFFQGYRDNEELRPIIEKLGIKHSNSCIPYSVHCVAVALTVLPKLINSNIDQAAFSKVLLPAMRSWLYQQYSCPIEMYSHDIDAHAIYTSSPLWLKDHQELHVLIQGKDAHAFRLAMKEYEDEIPDVDRIFLFACAISVMENLLEENESQEVVLSCLSSLPWQALYLALSVSFDGWKLFQKVFSMFSTIPQVAPEDRFIAQSVWWPHRTTSVMCCWVWSPSCLEQEATQRKRLEILLERGFSIDDAIYEGGNAMHALFEDDPWGGLEYLPTPYGVVSATRRSRFYFTKHKFDLLIEKGVDLSLRGRYGTVKDAATRLLGILKEKSRRNADNEAGNFFAYRVQILEDHVLKILTTTSS